jgi:hypothetical protein
MFSPSKSVRSVEVRTFGLSLKQSQARAMSCFSRSVSSFLGSMLEKWLEYLWYCARA